MTNVVGPPLQAAAATQLSRRCPCPWRDAIETHATTDASGRGGLRTPSKALAERRGGLLLGERGGRGLLGERGGRGLLGERGRGGGLLGERGRGGGLLGERGRGGGLLGERGRGGGRGDPAAAGHPEHL